MEKINKLLSKYLIYAVPFHLLFIAGAYLGHAKVPFMGLAAAKVFIDILSWNFILWFAVIVFMVCQLLFNGAYRSGFFEAIKRMAGVKERDEREAAAVDSAARYAYISTLSLLVFILFVLSVSVTIGKLPPDKVVDGKTKTISIGAGIALWDDGAAQPAQDGSGVIFSTARLPLSKWSLIALITAWHLLSFLFYVRRAGRTKKIMDDPNKTGPEVSNG
ncbi:MAG: hypothetical protein LLG37_03780 [Spirochaetia bacterium]|nr:hypothetical protein [Spirochaetia bacterium]